VEGLAVQRPRAHIVAETCVEFYRADQAGLYFRADAPHLGEHGVAERAWGWERRTALLDLTTIAGALVVAAGGLIMGSSAWPYKAHAEVPV